MVLARLPQCLRGEDVFSWSTDAVRKNRKPVRGGVTVAADDNHPRLHDRVQVRQHARCPGWGCALWRRFRTHHSSLQRIDLLAADGVGDGPSRSRVGAL